MTYELLKKCSRYVRKNRLICVIKFISARRVAILKNNVEVDAKVKCIENGIAQAQIVEKSETSSSYVNRIIKKSEVLNKTFIRMMEELGYDVELIYVKRTEE